MWTVNPSMIRGKNHYMLQFCSRDDVYQQCHSFRGCPPTNDVEWLAPRILPCWPASYNEEFPRIVSAASFLATRDLKQNEHSRTL
jgi:hypothetical protein